MPSFQLETLRLSDGYETHVRWWRPPNPRGAVLYFHGIQSHGGWYETSGGRLADAGFNVLMPDRRGSGLNRAQRGHAVSDQQIVEDATDFLNATLHEGVFPSVHVVGVSWGGKPAVSLAAQVPGRVASITLIAPGLFPRVDLTTVEKMRVALALVNDRNRLFEIPLNDPRLFTSNPEKIGFVNADQLKLTQVTASFLLATRRLDKIARKLDRSPWRGPVHLMLAGRDRIIENGPTRDWFDALPSRDRQISDYPLAYHTIEFEPDPSRFFDDLVTWISARTPPAPRAL